MAINFPDSPTSGDTHTVGDKTWTWNGTSWDVVVSTPISNQIIDADGDTRIHVEESPDEDYIRFDTAGTERMTIGPTGDVVVTNDLSVTGTISGGSTSFPTSLDSGTMPAIEALQAKVGVDSSAVTSSLDYKVAQLEGRDTAGLVHISRTTIGTAVSSVTVSSAFSADYRNYLIVIDNTDASANTTLDLQLDGLTADYYYNSIYMAGNSTTVNGVAGYDVSAWQAGACRVTGENTYFIKLGSPFQTTRTTFFFEYSGSGLWYTGGGVTTNTASRTGFVLTPASGTITGGTIDVYGYAGA